MDPDLFQHARAALGFMPDDEGLALHEAGLAAAETGPLLEVGTYCGKSAVWITDRRNEVSPARLGVYCRSTFWLRSVRAPVNAA